MRYRGLLLFLVLPFLTACEDQSLPPFSSLNEVNRWIYQEMKLWYYWSDKLPEKPDFNRAPDGFFNDLLYPFDPNQRPDGDRFSWIQANVDELSSSLSGEYVSYGMEYRIGHVSDIEKTIGTVLYVLPGSPADQAGVKRGDTFTQVNDQEITLNNFRTLLAGNTEKKFTLAEYNPESKIFEPQREVSLQPVRLQEDPVHYSAVINRGNKLIGYLVYHQFFPSTNGTNDLRFDRKLESVFEDFKKQGIDELIVDLRYNSGGYVSSANLLASLIAPGVTSKDVFSIKEYNPRVTEVLKKNYGNSIFFDYFSVKNQNVGALINRVFVLTSKRTSSASELLINGLLPYMDVKIAGDTTVGKNVGSITIRDEEKRTQWGLQPIVSKSFNGRRESNYSAGFAPDYTAVEGLLIYPYGDDRDPLLKAALNAITSEGNQHLRTAELGSPLPSVREVTSSLRDKPSAMFENKPDF